MRALRRQFLLTYMLLSAVGVYIPMLLDRQLGPHQNLKGPILALNGLAIVLAPVFMAYLADTHVRIRTLLAASFGLCGLGAALLMCAAHGGGDGAPWVIAAMAGGYLFYTFAVRPQGTLQDGLYFTQAHALEACGQKPPPYATVRIFGSWGYLAPLLLLGSAAAWQTHHGRHLPMWIPMAVAAACALAGLLNTLGLPPAELPAREGKGLPTAEAAAQVSRFGAWPLFAGMTLVHMGTVAYFSYQPKLLTTTYGLPEDWVSWVPALDVVLELAPMLLAPWLIDRFGARKVLLWAVAAQVIRYVLFALAPSWIAPWCAAYGADAGSLAGCAPLWAAIGIKSLLHGPVIIGLYVVPPILLNRMATPTCRNSVQALYTMLAVGGGVLIGNLAFGRVAETLGLPATFLGSAAVMTLGLGVLFFGRWRDNPAHPPAAKEEAQAPPSGSSAQTDV